MKQKIIIAIAIAICTLLGTIYTATGNEDSGESDKKNINKNIVLEKSSDIRLVPDTNKTIRLNQQVESNNQYLDISEQTYAVWTELKELLAAGEIDISIEKQLIKSLRSHPNPLIFEEINQLLQYPDENLISRNQEYLLSLLAVINTTESAKLFLTALTKTDISDSNAIYAAKKSLQRLAVTDKHLRLFEDTFTAMGSDNLFLNDIATAIAENANEQGLDYLVTQVNNNDEKSSIALNSLKKVTKERLVPQLQQLIASKEGNSELKMASLQALAHMGQYEATVTLINWSALQAEDSKELIQQLFTTASQRSPSTYRAIEKELNSYQFISQDIKFVIQNIYLEKAKIGND